MKRRAPNTQTRSPVRDCRRQTPGQRETARRKGPSRFPGDRGGPRETHRDRNLVQLRAPGIHCLLSPCSNQGRLLPSARIGWRIELVEGVPPQETDKFLGETIQGSGVTQ